MVKQGDIRVGCCGFGGSQKDYFRKFPVVEIQQTFYQLPRIETALKWRRAAPAGFQFTMKAWQLITHEPTSPTYRRLRKKIDPEAAPRYGRFRPTDEVAKAAEETLCFARQLDATVLVFQCPASFLPDDQNIANLEKFFSQIPRGKIHLAWEPRGAWPQALVGRLCRDLGLIHCVDPFQNKPHPGSIQYFRLHGIGGYRYRFTDQDLEGLKKKIKDRPSYVLFNNLSMKEDALRFQALI